MYSSPSIHCSISAGESYFQASVSASSNCEVLLTLLIPILEPSKIGLTAQGRGNSTAGAGSPILANTEGDRGKSCSAQMSLVVALFIHCSEALEFEPV